MLQCRLSKERIGHYVTEKTMLAINNIQFFVNGFQRL